MPCEDIRWKQRFSNYQNALNQLQRFLDKGELSEFEEQGLIKSFEYTYELAWNTLKDFLEFQGHSDIYGSRDALRKAFQLGIVEDGAGWMDMLQSRNKTSHTYHEEMAQEVVRAIRVTYYHLFVKLDQRLSALSPGAE